MDTLFKNKQRTLVIVVFAIVFLAIYYLNVLYPIFGDDWAYTFVWTRETETPARISSLMDILISQYNHYMLWGGRSVVHAIDQLLLWGGETVHNLLNSLMFVLYLFIIYRISNIGNNSNVILLIITIMVLWYLHPVFSQTVLWITGSANYLWGTTIVLLFIYPYYAYYRGKEITDSVFKYIIFFAAGIIAGWTLENVGIAMLFVLVSILFLLRLEKQRIPVWAISGLIGGTIGFLILILAPGNYVRLDSIYESEALVGLSKWEVIKVGFPNMWIVYRKALLIPSLVYAVLCIIYLKFNASESKIKVFRSSMVFFIASYLAYFSMLASPQFPLRATFGLVSLFIIAITLLYANIKINHRYFNYINAALVVVFFVFFCGNVRKNLKYLNYISDLWHRRELYVEEQKKKNNMDITFVERIKYNKKFEIVEFSGDPDFWYNKMYAYYFGVKSVKTIEDKK